MNAETLLREFIEASITYYCGDYASQCGWTCDHCDDYFKAEFPEGKKRERNHPPDCLVRRADEFLQGMGVGGQ